MIFLNVWKIKNDRELQKNSIDSKNVNEFKKCSLIPKSSIYSKKWSIHTLFYQLKMFAESKNVRQFKKCPYQFFFMNL